MCVCSRVCVCHTPPSEGLSSIQHVGCGARGGSMPNSGVTNRPKAMPSILVLLIMITVTFGFYLLPLCSWFSNYLEPGQGKGTWPGFWPSRKLLCFSLSLTMAAEFLCKSHLQSGPRLHPHDGNQPPSWTLCAWLPGRRPCISDKITFSSLYTLKCLLLPRSPPSYCWVPMERGTQPVISGQPGPGLLGGPTRWASHPKNLFWITSNSKPWVGHLIAKPVHRPHIMPEFYSQFIQWRTRRFFRVISHERKSTLIFNWE